MSRQRGIRAIFICFADNQKGYKVLMPSTRQICVSSGVMLDKISTSVVAPTWRQFHDSLALQPIATFIPGVNTTMESTGSILDMVERVEGGDNHHGNQN